MRSYPALVLEWPSDPTEDEQAIALAVVDDEEPVAVDAIPLGIRIFFRTASNRDAAGEAISRALPGLVTRRESVPDDDWAERSQAAITSVTVGRIVVSPPWLAGGSRIDASGRPDAFEIVIQPSMGFGTGHHPSTRLCLALIQDALERGQTVLDAGTGSGLLAIAARRLGAGRVVAIDVDGDALENARENLTLNGLVDQVDLRLEDVSARNLGPERFNLALANLTGGLLVRTASALIDRLVPGGLVIASGFQAHELETVGASFDRAGGNLILTRTERGPVDDEWVGVLIRRRSA